MALRITFSSTCSICCASINTSGSSGARIDRQHHTASFGFDAKQREHAVDQVVQRGRAQVRIMRPRVAEKFPDQIVQALHFDHRQTREFGFGTVRVVIARR